MSHTLLALAVHAYVVAAAVYLTYLVRPWQPLATAGRALVCVGFGLHAVSLADQLSHQGGLPQGVGQGFSALAFLLLGFSCAMDLRYRQPVIGAFLVPLAVAVLLPGVLLNAQAGQLLTPAARGPLLPLHVTVALVGVAAAASAAGVALMYVLMERTVKAKQFGLVWSRLPSLEFLDGLNRRLLLAGFVAISITLVTGAFFASGEGGFAWAWGAKQVATLVAWAVFAALLTARLLAGWRGRRAALLTLAGFCLLLVSLVSSFDPGRLSGSLN